LWLAREWGLAPLEAALADAVDREYEPTFDAARGEFTWGFGLDEGHPRGQFNGTMAAAQIATEGSWWTLANVGPGTRFAEPTVEGVDFPALALDQASWNAERQVLTIGTVPMNQQVTGRPTRFRVVNLAPAGDWDVVDERDQPVGATWSDGALEIATTLDRRRLRVRGPRAR
jgi:hypothetical protein